VPETLPAEVLSKMFAPAKPDVPIITAAELPEADGFIFGFPTRCAHAETLYCSQALFR
jgi:NAD(P)H dehydrogenase (quinone)